MYEHMLSYNRHLQLRTRDLLAELYTIEDVAGVSRGRRGATSPTTSKMSDESRGSRSRREWAFGQWASPGQHGHISGYAPTSTAARSPARPPSSSGARPPAITYNEGGESTSYVDDEATRVVEPQPPAFGYTPPPQPPTAAPSLGVDEFQATCES